MSHNSTQKDYAHGTLAFLNSDTFDHDIEQKSARPQLIGLLRNAFEIDLPESTPLTEVRQRVSRHVLLTDFLAGLGEATPPFLGAIKIASAAHTREACISLAHAWRLRRDVRDSYVVTAKQVEQTLGPSSFVISPSLLETKANGQRALDQFETFLAIERALLRHVEHALLQSADATLLDLAESHLSRFWSDVTPAVQAHWALIAAAAEVLLQADQVAKALKKAPSTVPTLIRAYAEGDALWCLLDTARRHMESRWYAFEPESGADYGSLDQLIVKAEQRYAEVGSALAKHFTRTFEKAKHPQKDILYQRNVFATQVKPRLDNGKTAYVWVDALRFEMARELCHVLQDDFDLTLQLALGTIPTITEIGMAALLPKAAALLPKAAALLPKAAALLPKAGESAKVVAVGGGKLGFEIDGTIIKDRKDRIAFLKAHAGVPVFDAKLDDLLPKPSKKIRDGIKHAQLVLITSQEIDELCEQDNIAQARRQMDGVLHDLRRGVRILGELGITSIMLAADHGHLFADGIGEDMKIDAPAGNTADLHRRGWVGVGGTAEPSYLRTSLVSFGVDSELDIATPWTFACFKAKGGARAYFHGGLSPQELIIPVVVLTPTAQALAGPPKLTTRFFSVQISGVGTGLFAAQPPKVRVEIHVKGVCVSQPVSASYGFEDATGEVHLRVLADDTKVIDPNTVTVMLVDEIAEKAVKVHLLDATSGAELARLDRIEVALAF